MGWSQWARLRFVNNSSDKTLQLKFPDPSSHWGWTFEDNRDNQTRNEISYERIESHDIRPRCSFAYGHTGKGGEACGMSGTVEIWTKPADGEEGKKIARIYYSCPYSGSSEFVITDRSEDWRVEDWGADFNATALGSISLDVFKL